MAMTLLMLLIATGAILGVAMRVNRRARARHHVSAMQRATLALCAQIMSDDKNSSSARKFAGQIAVMVMSERTLWMFGSNRELVRRLARIHEGSDGSGGLSDADRRVVQPALEIFALAALMYDPKISRTVRDIWQRSVSAAYARSASGGRASKNTEPVSPPQPISKKMEKIERIVEREVREQLCHA